MEALVRAVLGSMRHSPCFVSFSGGRDSSAVLAVATRVARAEGLSDPVPVTLLFDEPEAEESKWQEIVIRHLKLSEWVRIRPRNRITVLGSDARVGMRRHGILWPPNVFIHVPMMEVAEGATLLTGFDGDGLFGGWSGIHLADVIQGRTLPVLRDVPRLIRHVAPPPLGNVMWRPTTPAIPWLSSQAAGDFRRKWAQSRSDEPASWRDRTVWFSRSRHLMLAKRSLDRIATDFHVEVVHPLLNPGFVSALGRAGGWLGLGDRTSIMRYMFQGLLPKAVIERSSKATFTSTLWGRDARKFEENWNGKGLSTELFEEPVLRRAWRQERPRFQSATALQAAWLATEGHP